MDFYPIKKLLKEHEALHPEKKRLPRQQLLFKSSHSLSPKEQFLTQYYHQQGNPKRFDRDFTLSWGQKGKVSQSSNFHPLAKSTFQSSGFSTTSPVNAFQSQLKQSAGPVTNQHSLKGYKSDLSLSAGFSLMKSSSNPAGFCIKTDYTKGVDTNRSGGDTLLDGSATLAKSHFFNMETSKENSADVLGDLQEIYYKDLKAETSRISRPSKLEASPYSKAYAKKFRTARKSCMETMEPDYNELMDDNVLLEKFEDPYGKHLPFEKHVNANINDQKKFKLQELEMKAQILRNLKSIQKTINDAPSPNRSNKLPQIKKEVDESYRDSFMTQGKKTGREKTKSVCPVEKEDHVGVYFIKDGVSPKSKR